MATNGLEGALLGTLQPEASVREAAEAHLAQAATQPGFAPQLAQAARNPALQDSFRQLALVVLKKYIKEHWEEGSRHFQPPLCSDLDKDAVRRTLPDCLADANSKVRTAAAMAVSAAAQHDFPNQWPGLLEWMIGAVRDQQNPHLVLGVLRCLAMIAEDIGEQMPQVVGVLLPSLHAVLSNPQYPPGVQRHVLSILHAILSQLGVMQGAYQRQVRDLLVPLLQPWIPTLAAVMAAPLSKDPRGWALKMECLQVITGLVTYFGKVMSDGIPALLAPCWQLFTGSGRALYHELLVVGGEQGGEAAAGGTTGGGTGAEDEEGEAVGLEAMLSQMFELLLTLLGSPRFSKLLRPVLQDLAYTTITYMQMTCEQAEVWAGNPNQYVADEEDVTCTARVSGELLLDELCRGSGSAAIKIALDCVERALRDADVARGGGGADVAAHAWKLREAAVTAAGCVAQALLEQAQEEGLEPLLAGVPGRHGAASAARRAGQKQVAAVNEAAGRLRALLDQILHHDLQGPHSNPFLAGRALWACAKMSAVMSPPQVDLGLNAACAGIQGALPAPVRIGACRALVSLLPRIGDTAPGGAAPHAQPTADHVTSTAAAKLAPVLPGLYDGLVRLLSDSSEETQHLVLETLQAVVAHDAGCVVRQYLGAVAGPVLRVWEESVADPLIGEDATAVLSALAAHPECLQPLVNELLPVLVRVISQPAGQRPMLVEASLGLLRQLVRRPQAAGGRGRTRGGRLTLEGGREAEAVTTQHLAVVKQIYTSVIGPLLALIHTSDDPSVQQEAQQLLCQLVRSGRGALLTWDPAGPEATVSQLMGAVFHLLGGRVGEAEAALAGHVATDVLTSFPQPLLAPYTPQLLECVCSALVRVNMSQLVSGLLLVLSRLAHVDTRGLLTALTALTVKLPSGEVVPALQAVLPIWADRAVDVVGGYYTCLVTTALGLVLEADSPAVQALQVRGKRLDTAVGVRTRSQVAAAGGEQYSVASGPMKLVAALAQTLVHAQEADDIGRGGLLGDETGEGDSEEEEYETDSEGEGGSTAPGSSHHTSPGQERVEGAGAGGGGRARPPALAIRGASYTPAQASLLRSVSGAVDSEGGAGSAWLHDMAVGDGLSGLTGGDGPLSPASVLHEDDAAPGVDDAAPPGDPLASLDVGRWVTELFQRLALTDSGMTLLQASGEHAMSRKQAQAVHRLLHVSRLRP